MFSPYTNNGFYYAPVTKLLLGGVFASTVAVTFPLSNQRHLFTYSPEDIIDGKQVWKLLTSKLAFLDPKDFICAAMLLYNFRVFERRLGSRKYVGYLVATMLLSTILEAAVLISSHYLDVQLHKMPTGPFGVIFSMFVPFFCDIPRVAMTHIMGIPVTGKSLAYLVGLQMCSDSVEGVILAACGIVSGLLFRSNFLVIQKIFIIPKSLGDLAQKFLGKHIESSSSNQQGMVGATLEIQRQQQMERLEEQMIRAQLLQHNIGGRAGNVGNLLPNLFGNQNAQNMQNGNNVQAPTPPDPQPGPSQSSGRSRFQADEAHVALLLDMGFNRDNIVNALRVTNNNASLATNILLQQS